MGQRPTRLRITALLLVAVYAIHQVRMAIEERASYSPDALSGLEANLRFAGPETIETKIFARLSLWQNWVFQRPNAVGERGALRLYGTGQKAAFDPDRV